MTMSDFSNNYCPHSPINEPKMNGVTFLTTMELVGRLPVKTLCGKSASNLAPLKPDFSNSARACASDLPAINASVWAKKLANKILWCEPFAIGFCVTAGAMKSHGIKRVPFKKNRNLNQYP